MDHTAKTHKRDDVLSWSDFFMGVALIAAKRSKYPSCQVGACIVNPDNNRIIAMGYNGFPQGCSDDEFPWSHSSEHPDEPLKTKYPFVVHAELNAVLNKNAESTRGCTMYTTLHPCNECGKVIIQSGIQKVIYLSDKHHDRCMH
jgi:dCMP deaminase